MKTLINKKTELEGKDNEKLDYADMIGVCLNQAKQGGFSLDDIEQRLRIKSATGSKKDDNIELEDSDVQNLKKIVKNTKWPNVHEDILEFSKAVEAL